MLHNVLLRECRAGATAPWYGPLIGLLAQNMSEISTGMTVKTRMRAHALYHLYGVTGDFGACHRRIDPRPVPARQGSNGPCGGGNHKAPNQAVTGLAGYRITYCLQLPATLVME
jgi:hypothetical protein